MSQGEQGTDPREAAQAASSAADNLRRVREGWARVYQLGLTLSHATSQQNSPSLPGPRRSPAVG